MRVVNKHYYKIRAQYISNQENSSLTLFKGLYDILLVGHNTCIESGRRGGPDSFA
jgi:hypothetical protein